MELIRRFNSWSVVILAVTIAALLVPTGRAQAATYYIVDDNADPGTCNNLVAGYANLQTAVDTAIIKGVHTILLCPGSYYDFTITGANGLVIKAAVRGSFPTISPFFLIPFPPESGYIIHVQQKMVGLVPHPSVGVVIDGLKLDGFGFSDALTGDTAGIYFHNSSGVVRNSIITGIRNWPDMSNVYGNGVRVLDDNADGKLSVVSVVSTNITDVASANIYAEGPAKVVISKTNMVGNFSGGGVLGFEGVHFESKATGSMTASIISNVSRGMFILGGSNIKIAGNTFSTEGTAITISAYCGYGNANANSISGNTFMFTGGAVSDVVAIGSSSSVTDTCTPHADYNVISSNRFVGTPGSDRAVLVWKLDGVSFPASAKYNKVTGNMIYSFTEAVYVNGATNTITAPNTVLP